MIKSSFKYFIICAVIFFMSSTVIGQSIKKDSLWSIWANKSQHDTIRLNAIDKYLNETKNTVSSDSAYTITHQMLDFAIKSKQKWYQAKAYRQLCDIDMRESKWAEAISHTSRAYQLYEEENDKRGMAGSLWSEGLVYWQTDQNIKTLNSYTQSLSLLEKLNDSSGMSGVLNNIGLLFKQQEDYDTAMDYFKKSVEIGNWDKSGNSVAERNIGNVHIKLGNYDEALNIFEELIKIAQEERTDYHHNTMRGLYSSIAQVYKEQGNFEKALTYYYKGLNHVLKDSLTIGTKRIETDIGSVYVASGKAHQAIEWCTKGFERGKKGKAVSLQKRSCKCLYDAYKMLGDNTNALKYLELVETFNDSLKSVETTKALLNLKFKKQVLADSLSQANQSLKTEIAHQKETRQKDRVRNLSFGLVALLLLLATSLYRRNRYVNKAKISIEKEKVKAESSEKAKHQFLANMSHEIRTPMNAIKGMTDILIRRNPKDDQKEYLDGIKQSSDSLLFIINDILDISKIEAGKIELHQEPFSINNLVNKVHTIMHFKAEEKGLQLQKNLPSEPISVNGDATRLRQILINLIGNAIKFTEKGVVTTTITSERDGDNLKLHFTVSDTGIGIDKDRINKIFKSFEQAYSDTSRKFGGTGLGLSISKKLVELHKGKIWVESEKGKGSQFHFTIPYEVEDVVINDEQQNNSENNIAKQLKGINILLVEDNQFNAVVAQEELEDAIENVNVDVAENGAIAVEKMKSNDYDIILMDVQMPKMNGYEATKIIRSLDKDKGNTPIIAMTANVMKEEIEKCYEVGMNDFIGKPFDTEELLEKTHNLIKNK